MVLTVMNGSQVAASVLSICDAETDIVDNSFKRS
jgi:hypothetical protein